MTEPRTLTLLLPWPPSTNRIWRAVGGRILLAEVARKYALQVQNALPSGLVEPLRGRLQVEMNLHQPAKQSKTDMDIANREKCLFDCLTKQRVWIDDSQIDELHIRRGPPYGAGHVYLRITELDEIPQST